MEPEVRGRKQSIRERVTTVPRVGPAVVTAVDDEIEFVDRFTGGVRAVVGGPKPALRIEGKVIRVTQASGEDSQAAAVGIRLEDRPGALVRLFAVVAGGAARGCQSAAPLGRGDRSDQMTLPVAERGYPHPELLAETDWLASHLSDATVRIVDARTDEEYAAGHIPGAVHISGFSLGGIQDAEPARFAQRVGALGIDDQAAVVVYDGG